MAEKEEATIWLAEVATATAGGDADEEQERGDQKSAADAEHARQDTDQQANAQ